MKQTIRLILSLTALIATSTGGLMAQNRTLDAAPEDAFTIVVIPDTQRYEGAGTKRTPDSTDAVTNERFNAQVEWIMAHLQSQRIVFVTHVGDIVEYDREAEWEVAASILAPLHGTVPYSLTVGNHDMSRDGDARLFQRFFPASKFEPFDWYLESYSHDREDQHVSANNVNSAQLFSAMGLDFIHLSLECNAPDDVLQWAGELLKQHGNRLALVTTHMDLGVIDKPQTREGYWEDPQGVMRWSKIHGERGNSGEQLWDKLYRFHPNLRIIFSGDQSWIKSLHTTSQGDHGNTVHRAMSDYGSSWPIRLYRFIPTENRVDAITLDVRNNQLIRRYGIKEQWEDHQFTMEVDLTMPTNPLK